MLESLDLLTAAEVSERWRGVIKPRTLAQWRYEGRGPAYQKLGGRVMYSIGDIEAYEREHHISAKCGTLNSPASDSLSAA